MSLTDNAIRNAKPRNKPFRLFDGGGLYLEVSPKGGKWWRLKYRYNGKEKRLSLGVYPEIELKSARERCFDARKLLNNGIDPSENRKATKNANKNLLANSLLNENLQMNLLTIDWNKFRVKNKNYNTAFEDLCYHLFCREFECSNGESADFNNVGLETETILYDGKYYGFQAKFFENKIDYSKIKESVKKALKHYKGRLHVIYVYLNILPSKCKVRDKIDSLAKKDKVKIKYIVPSNFKIMLNQPKNLDLAQLYFGSGDELGFITFNFSKPEILTLLKSKECLDLPFKSEKNDEETLSNVREAILDSSQDNKNNIFLIMGQPGSGKSICMLKLYQQLSGLDQENKTSQLDVLLRNNAIPMLINLRDCKDHSLENLIRNRKQDYEMKDRNFIYLFDGLDELDQETAESALLHISKLLHDSRMKKIVISCRSCSSNLILLKNHVINAVEYKINKLTVEYIERYFKNKNNMEKIDKLKDLKRNNDKLLEEIDDIFSITILWDTLEKLKNTGDILDLFAKKIDLLLDKNISSLNLLESKKERIIEINQEIAFKLQEKFQFRFSLSDLQNIIIKKHPLLDYRSINAILTYLSSNLLDDGTVKDSENCTYVYLHRRYQEYFLVRKLKQEYEKSPKILRELNILSNYDLLQLFLSYLKKGYMEQNDLPGAIGLNLINVYLGYGKGNITDSYETDYLSRSEFISALANQDNVLLEQLLNDDNLQIKDKILFTENDILNLSQRIICDGKDYFNNKTEFKINNLINTVFYFNKAGKHDGFAAAAIDNFKKLKIELFKNGKLKKIFCRFIKKHEKKYIYILLVLLENPIVSHLELIRKSGKEKNIYSFELNECFANFVRICLEEKLEEFIDVIDEFNQSELLEILKVLCEPEYLYIIFQESGFSEKIKQFISSYPNITKETIHILFYKKIYVISLTDEEKKLADNCRIKMLRDTFYSPHYYDYALICFTLDTDDFGKIKKDYYSSLRLYAALFKNFVNIYYMKDNENIASSIRCYTDYIRSFKNIESQDYKISNIEVAISKLWGLYIADFAKFDHERCVNLPPLINNILLKEPESQIDLLVFSSILKTRNSGFFREFIVNYGLEKIENKYKNKHKDFFIHIDECFHLANIFSDVNNEKAYSYIAKGINDSVLRYGFHKDTLISRSLVDALAILWKNNWESTENLEKYANEVFKLILRLYFITDGDGTRYGICKIIKLVAEHNIKLAEEFLEKFESIKYKPQRKRYFYDLPCMISNVVLLQAKIKHGLSIEEIQKGIGKIKNHFFDLGDDYQCSLFKIYLSVAHNYYYNDEERTAFFDKAYGLVELDEAKNILDSHLCNKEKKLFNDLCQTYKRESDIKFKIETSSSEQEQSEVEFIKNLQPVTSEGQLRDLYDTLNSDTLTMLENWKILINKTFDICGNIKLFLHAISEKYFFPHLTDCFVDDSSLAAIADSLNNINTKQEAFDWLAENSGYDGFVGIMKIYEIINDRNMCLKLFKTFVKFCDFLVN